MIKNNPTHVYTPSYIFHLGAHCLPLWDNATRPSSPKRGDVGYNTDTEAIEMWVGHIWKSLISN